MARAWKIQAFGWSAFAGVGMGAAVGHFLGHLLLGVLLGPLIIWVVALTISALAGRGVTLLYTPSGSSTPRRPEHSRPRALVARGEYQEAIRAYEEALLDVPGDAEALLGVARIHRDHLDDPEAALLWFKRTLKEGELARGQEILARRELVELLTHRLEEPRRAAPELARLAHGFPNTPDGRWAREELRRIKEEMAEEQGW